MTNFYVHNNTFFSVISKIIRVILPIKKCKEKNIMYGIMEDFIDTIIFE